MRQRRDCRRTALQAQAIAAPAAPHLKSPVNGVAVHAPNRGSVLARYMESGPSASGFHSIESALLDIAAGKFVVVLDDEDRENEGDLIIAADKVAWSSFPSKECCVATSIPSSVCSPVDLSYDDRKMGIWR